MVCGGVAFDRMVASSAVHASGASPGSSLYLCLVATVLSFGTLYALRQCHRWVVFSSFPTAGKASEGSFSAVNPSFQRRRVVDDKHATPPSQPVTVTVFHGLTPSILCRRIVSRTLDRELSYLLLGKWS